MSHITHRGIKDCAILRPVKPAREIVIAADGAVAPSGKAARELLGGRAGRHEVIAGPPGLLLLQQVGSAGKKRSRVLAAGEIITKTTVLELVSTIMNNSWQGELSIWDTTHTRRLRLDQGAIKAAQSDKPSERLGEVMVALGVLTSEQLERCVSRTSVARRLGEVAISEDFVNPPQLFAMLQAQAERIFQAGLLVERGSYEFAVLQDDTEAPLMALHIPVQALLFESVQRIDEMTHFRKRIPSGDLRPNLTDVAARITIGESLRPVAALSDGEHSIHEIGRELHLDEFDVTKKVMQLLQIGCLELKEQQVLSSESVGRIVRELNEILREVEDTVERHGSTKAKDQMLWTLAEWVRDSPFAEYFGSAFGRGGEISEEATLAQLLRLGIERPVERLHGAANELVSFVMLCASPKLPREAERALAKWVNQRISRMRV